MSTNGQLPPALLDEFRAFRGAGDDGRFGLGDRIEIAVVEFAGKLTARAIYKAAAIETDISIAEARMLHETARACDEPLRDEFMPPLVFQHFRTVRYVDDRGKRSAYLRLAVESADDWGGRPMPAVKLEQRIRADLGLAPPPPTFAELMGRAHANVTKALEVYETEAQRAEAQRVLKLLERYA